jgi:hypothetical protein
MTTSSPSLGIALRRFPWLWDRSYPSTSKLPKSLAGITRDVAVKRSSLVSQLKLAPSLHCYPGRRTMIVREALCIAPLPWQNLLAGMEVSRNRLSFQAVGGCRQRAISLVEIFACHSTMSLRMGLSYRRHAGSEIELPSRWRSGTIIRLLLEELE